MWCKGYRTVVLGKVAGATLVYWCNNGSFKIYWYFAWFRETLYSSWIGWAWLLLLCLRSITGNSSGPPEKFCEIVFIASMMYSLILMSNSVFPCGCPKKSDTVGSNLIVIVGPGVPKTLLYYSFSRSLIFLLLGSRFPSSSWRGPIPALIAELFLRICKTILCFSW